MKNLMIGLFVVFFSNVALAGDPLKNENTEIQVVRIDETLFELNYLRNSSSIIRIKIINEEGITVYSERLREGKFSRPYNLEKLPSGTYTLEVKDEQGVYRHTLDNHPSTSPLQFTSVRINKVDDQRHKVTLYTTEATEVLIRVYDENSTLLHVETVKVQGAYASLFRLQDVTKGFFSVSINGHVDFFNF
jgi:hypothetical protein